jgi:ATP-dependent HslUV protease ATP-binding subunit HslU
MKVDLDKLTPRQIVEQLDKYIIGQEKAKKAVAIALRNRMRRQRLSEDMRDEVAPKNIIMIGPTGVGKTEIARRLSRLVGAPFLKVEATKYTEVGYVGRDVESMIRDLVQVAVSMVKASLQEEVRQEAERRAEEALLDLLLPGIKPAADQPGPSVPEAATAPEPPALSGSTREKFREKLKRGELEEKTVEVNVTRSQLPAIEIFSGASFEELDLNIGNLGNLGSIFGGRKKRKKTTVSRAREILLAEEMDKLVDMDRVTEQAIQRVEQMGIVFIDEIDKIASTGNKVGPDVSREGVQRDILPIVEGSKVNTKHGMIDTGHILFIAAGAFHVSKPSDLIPELQGRFPIRVELTPLTEADFVRIMTEPENALTKQYQALVAAEGAALEFTADGIAEVARIASVANDRMENIGARRLHTVMSTLMEDVLFDLPDWPEKKIVFDATRVRERLSKILDNDDLRRYIL